MAIRLLIISSFIITKLIGDGWELHGEFQLRVKLISCDGIDYFWLFIIGINRSRVADEWVSVKLLDWCAQRHHFFPVVETVMLPVFRREATPTNPALWHLQANL